MAHVKCDTVPGTKLVFSKSCFCLSGWALTPIPGLVGSPAAQGLLSWVLPHQTAGSPLAWITCPCSHLLCAAFPPEHYFIYLRSTLEVLTVYQTSC